MSKTKQNPFAVYMQQPHKKATIKSLDNYEITYRELTAEEADVVNAKLISGIDDNGKPVYDFAKASEVKYEKVSHMLIDPAVTVEELKSLPATKAREIIEEILTLVEEDDGTDDEGN